MENEVAVCTTCHALIHAGLLRVSADAHGEVSWLPAVSDRFLGCGVASDRDVADLLPVLRLESASANGNGPIGDTHKSANADSDADPTPVQRDVVADHGLDLDALACGLIRLGVPAARSTS